MGFTEENTNRVFAFTIFALFIGLLIVMALIFDPTRVEESYNDSYNIARNNTIKQWNTNYSITDKLTLIGFNCESVFETNVKKCKADLAKELI